MRVTDTNDNVPYFTERIYSIYSPSKRRRSNHSFPRILPG